jgi:hypothetical protein
MVARGCRPFRRLTGAECAYQKPFRHDGIAIMALRSAGGQLLAYRTNPNHKPPSA